MDDSTATREGLDPYTHEPTLPEFTVGAVLGHSWIALKRDYWVLVAAAAFYLLVEGLVGLIQKGLFEGGGEELQWSFSGIDALLIDPHVSAGMAYIGLLAVRLRRPPIGKVFAGFTRYLTLIGIVLCLYVTMLIPLLVVGIGAGLGALVGLALDEPAIGTVGGAIVGAVPAFFLILALSARLWLARLIALDPLHDADRVFDCLRASWELTRGHTWPLVGLNVIAFVFAAASAAACCLPLLFIGIPIYYLVDPVAYEMLRRKAEGEEGP